MLLKGEIGVDSFRLFELLFGATTSAGVLYALLNPYFRKHSRKRKIQQIIRQEMEDNYETVSSCIFKNGHEDMDESDITIGDLYMCNINLHYTSWKMLKTEASELFCPRVFVTIDSYYFGVEFIHTIASRLESQGLVDDERKIRVKDHIPILEFEYVLWVSIEIIMGFTDRYLKMLSKNKELNDLK